MTVEELISQDSSKVRRDSNLMSFYIETFFKTFGYKPNCAGCTFNTDWYKLARKLSGQEENLVTLQKEKTMATFKLKRAEGKILSYKKDKITHRKYDTALTEEFVLAFLSNGTEEEIESRKLLFSKLPKQKTESFENTETEAPKVKKTRNRKPRK